MTGIRYTLTTWQPQPNQVKSICTAPSVTVHPPELSAEQRARSLVQSHFIKPRDAIAVLGEITFGIGSLNGFSNTSKNNLKDNNNHHQNNFNQNNFKGGELLYLGGFSYVVGHKGAAHRFPDVEQQDVPFLMASAMQYRDTSVQKNFSENLTGMKMLRFLRLMESRFMPDPDRYYAVRFTANCLSLRASSMSHTARSAHKSSDSESTFNAGPADWVMVGFRVPQNVDRRVNQPGFHLNAIGSMVISGEKDDGGRVVDFVLDSVNECFVQEIDHFIQMEEKI